MEYANSIKINQRLISFRSPAYFIADIASNHDGELQRALDLIYLAKESGADAVKFQHFKAPQIVSDYGFRNLGGQLDHQAAWKKSVYDTYKYYECKQEWTEELVKTAKKAGIDFFTTPYDIESLEQLDRYVPAYKIGSGDINWIDFIKQISLKGKPVLLSTGASTIEDVERAVAAIVGSNQQIVLLQCNTNYTGDLDNFRYVNLNVLKAYAIHFPAMILGLSDHTPGAACVLGAIALGARVIEKHFTDDNNREGPDHSFAMNPYSWRDMVERSRELELALGDSVKRIEENEKGTIVLQRRCLRLKRDIIKDELLQESDIESLRPAPQDAFPPYMLKLLIGKRLIVDKEAGDALYPSDLEDAQC
ncbi:MAG: N-acetylneuraminate synthase [Firmicutes bacterium HGW-Firmicutes-15]|nr:MAG: N-acetylneuraminate synthase [Firmicutes bacterium HGW-Firmicutes-15]